jgi:flagellar biosynthesis protein FlhF
MELKRIIARDTRAANEKAVALYGPDVLVISTSKVRGKTELIVAVDVEPMNAEAAVAETFVPTEKTYRLSATAASEESPLVPAESASFGKVLDDTMAMHKRQTKPAKAEATGFVPAATLKKAVQEKKATVIEESILAEDVEPVAAPHQASVQPVQAQAVQMAEERDALRGREIVQMVREELATLRKEFKLSQQMAWQGTGMARNLMPLRNALQEAAIPAALRALLIDSIQSFEDVEPAMEEIRRQLCHSMQHSNVSSPDQGVHVLAGPSGAGKSLMVARLAQNASVHLGSEQVAVISYSDQRAGAWNQTQLLSAQSGVDCFRATNVTTLKLLLEEHGQRKFIIIDTPGVQMSERVGEIAAICKEAQFHVVLPADASQSSLRRMLSTPQIQWQSLMISKLDEASQPWALIQVLTEGHVGVSTASRGERLSEWSVQMQVEELVTVALANLSLGHMDAPQEDMSSTLAMASARISRLAAQHTRSTHE